MKRVTQNGVVTKHERYIYRGYLQIAALDMKREAHPALWYVLWDPAEPVATRPLAIQKDGTWYTYGHDLTKNVWELYKANGTIATVYNYAPFGEVTVNGTAEQPFQWSSEFYDAELGMVYYNFRFYNPLDGRWISRDPIGENGGYALYGYSRNFPIWLMDFIGARLTEQMFIDCFFVKVFLEAKGFWGYYHESWEPNELKYKKSSPIFNIKVSGYWRTSTTTKTPEGTTCTCAEVRKIYEDEYPFSVTVRAYDINSHGNEELRYNQTTGLPIKTLLGTFHSQEMSVATQLVSNKSPNSIVAPGTVSYHLDVKNNKGIRMRVDVLTQEIYNEVHYFTY